MKNNNKSERELFFPGSVNIKGAYAIDSYNIWVECNCKKGYHTHGSNGDYTTNRAESRCSHGSSECEPYDTIIINNDTLRCTVIGRKKGKWKLSADQFDFRKRSLMRRKKRYNKFVDGCKSSDK